VPVHLFCTDLMLDFQPTSEVIWLTLKSDTSLSNHDSDFISFAHRTQCPPLGLGTLLTMQWAQFQHWGSDHQPRPS
jgi:hypothetical protein